MGTALLAGSISMLLAVPLLAAEADWTARLELQERYDDNIIQLSQRDLDRLAASGGGSGFGCGSRSLDTKGGRFTITSPGDHVLIPQLETSLKTEWLEGRPTAFGADASVYRYLTNDIKSYEWYRLSAFQPLWNGTDHQTTIGVLYGVVPSFYLRNLRSDRTAETLGVLPPPRRQATYHKAGLHLQVEQEIIPGRLRFTGSLGREDRNYNPCFDERDSRMPFHEFDLIYDPFNSGRLRVHVWYRREDLHAHGDLLDTPDFIEEDVSSRRDIWAGEVRFRWGPKSQRKSIHLRHEAEKRDFLTTDPNDISHFGRFDRRRFSSIVLRVDLRKGWFLTAAGERDINRSSFPTTPGSTFSPEEATDYTENLLQFGFGYEFGFGTAGSTGRLGGPPRE